MNDLVKTSNSSVTRYGDSTSPWRAFADQESRASFPGELLKFAKGEWTLGKCALEEEQRFLANMNEIWRGWVRWSDRQVTDTLIGRVIDRFIPPPREQLGDLDKSLWETELSGAQRDPWARTVFLVLRKASDDELLATFTSSSNGGISAVGKLADQFDRRSGKYPGKMPVVCLSSESYTHSSYGKIIKPAFQIVDWDYWDAEAAVNPEETLRLQRDAELDDEIPF